MHKTSVGTKKEELEALIKYPKTIIHYSEVGGPNDNYNKTRILLD